MFCVPLKSEPATPSSFYNLLNEPTIYTLFMTLTKNLQIFDYINSLIHSWTPTKRQLGCQEAQLGLQEQLHCNTPHSFITCPCDLNVTLLTTG